MQSIIFSLNRRTVFSAIRAVFSAAFVRGSGGLLRLRGFLVCNHSLIELKDCIQCNQSCLQCSIPAWKWRSIASKRVRSMQSGCFELVVYCI